MDKIIVTVTEESNSFFCDVEVPYAQKINTLKYDIIAALNGYFEGLDADASNICLFCKRTGKSLLEDKTFEDEGVRNGDYIYLFVM